jgi:hypothetical protein
VFRGEMESQKRTRHHQVGGVGKGTRMKTNTPQQWKPSTAELDLAISFVHFQDLCGEEGMRVACLSACLPSVPAVGKLPMPLNAHCEPVEMRKQNPLRGTTLPSEGKTMERRGSPILPEFLGPHARA